MARPDGVAAQAALRAEAPWDHRGALTVFGAVHRWPDGRLDLRDTRLLAQWTPLAEARATVRLRGGVSLPTGSTTNRFAFTPLSTGSFDPVVGVDGVFGGVWAAAVSAGARLPLYPGFDGTTQGAYGRLAVAGARRLSFGVVSAGLSTAAQAPSDVREGDFAELAAQGSLVWNLSERWGLSARLRVPLASAPRGVYTLAAGLGVTAVLGAPPDDHEH